MKISQETLSMVPLLIFFFLFTDNSFFFLHFCFCFFHFFIVKKFNTIPSDEEIAKMLFQFNEKIQRKNNANNKKNKEDSIITRTNIPTSRLLLSTPSVSPTLQPLIMPLSSALALEKLRIESIPASDLVDEEEERIKLKIERKNNTKKRTGVDGIHIECARCSESKNEIRVAHRTKAYIGQNLKYCELCWDIKARADKKKKEIECARCSESKTEIRVNKRTKAYLGQNLKYCEKCWEIKARADKKKN